MPNFYDELTLIADGASEPEGSGSTGDPTAFLAGRPTAGDTLALAASPLQSVYPLGHYPDPSEWVYVVQPVTRSAEASGEVPYELIAPIHCPSGTFGIVTVHPRDVAAVVRDTTTDRKTRCTDRAVHQPLRTLLNAI